MFCIKCKYISFDYLPKCPKCGFDWGETRKRMNLEWMVEPVTLEESVEEHEEVVDEISFEPEIEMEVEKEERVLKPQPDIEFEELLVEEKKNNNETERKDEEGFELDVDGGETVEGDVEFSLGDGKSLSGLSNENLSEDSLGLLEPSEDFPSGQKEEEILKEVDTSLEEIDADKDAKGKVKDINLEDIEKDLSIPISLEEKEDGDDRREEDSDDFSIEFEVEDLDDEVDKDSEEEDSLDDILDIEPSKK